MWVVKIGGSLMRSSYLLAWISTIVEYGIGKVVVVPGGGEFAEKVRASQARLQYDDVTAHKMALHAMEKFGALLQDIEPRLLPAHSETEIRQVLDSNNIPVWFPYEMVADNPAIQASWNITSDSLALWLAEQLNYQKLLLIKSTVPVNGDYSSDYLSRHGYLDKAFAQMFYESDVQTFWLSHERTDKFFSLLNQESNAAMEIEAVYSA